MSLDHSGAVGTPETAGAARVLVVVPVPPGRASDAGRTLASLAVQRDERADAVLVADGDVSALAARAGARLVADPGRGLAAAVNAGLATASPRHRYAAWLGVDDVLLPGALRVAAAALDADAGAVLAFGDCRYEASDGDYLLTVHTGSRVRQLVGVGFDPPATCATLFRLGALATVGGLDEELRYAMDLDLLLRLRRLGRFVGTGRTHAVYRSPAAAVERASTTAAVAETRAVLARHAPDALRPLVSAWRAPVRFTARWPLPTAQRGSRWVPEG